MIVKGLKQIVEHRNREHQKNVDEWCERKGLSPYMAREVKRQYYKRNPPEREWPTGANEVGDHDEDYVIDALFDIPNT